MNKKVLLDSLGECAIIQRTGLHWVLRYLNCGIIMFMELDFKSPGEKRHRKKSLQMERAYFPQLSELCYSIISNYNCVSFFNVFYADTQVANEADPFPPPALWFLLLPLAVLNCFVSNTGRHSEQLDNNKEARWGNGSGSLAVIMLIVHPTVLNQCFCAIFFLIRKYFIVEFLKANNWKEKIILLKKS